MTKVAKTSGAMMHLIRFKNRFERGRACQPISGKSQPIKIPRMSPMKILAVKEIFGIGISRQLTFHSSDQRFSACLHPGILVVASKLVCCNLFCAKRFSSNSTTDEYQQELGDGMLTNTLSFSAIPVNHS